MDTKKIIQKLKGEADRTATSLYLSKSTLEEFKKTCEKVTPKVSHNRVLEELMRDFIEGSKNIKKSRAIKKS